VTFQIRPGIIYLEQLFEQRTTLTTALIIVTCVLTVLIAGILAWKLWEWCCSERCRRAKKAAVRKMMRQEERRRHIVRQPVFVDVTTNQRRLAAPPLAAAEEDPDDSYENIEGGGAAIAEASGMRCIGS